MFTDTNSIGPAFIFAVIQNTKKEKAFTGVPYNIYTTKRAYFNKHRHIQNSYSEADRATLTRIGNKHNLFEVFESCYECDTHTAEQIKTILENEPMFEYSQPFETFIRNLSSK